MFQNLIWLVFHSFSIHFHNRPANFTKCVHYGEIPAHNQSSKEYSKFTMRSVTLTAKECGSCCVLGSFERHATMASFPGHSLCLLVLSPLHWRSQLLSCNPEACNANDTDSWKISMVINNEYNQMQCHVMQCCLTEVSQHSEDVYHCCHLP
jgi:hypothetical protein